MVSNVTLNCGPVRPETQFKNKINTKLAFGSEEIEEPEDSVELSEKADEAEEVVEEAAAKQPEDKFSIKRTAKHFCTGFATPIKQLAQFIDNPKGLATAVAGGIGIGYIAKKVPAFPKYAIVGASAIAGFNFGKGIFKFFKAENTDQKERSFKDIGKGTFYGVTAILPATKVAKTQKIIPADAKTNPFKSLVTCWKSTIKDAIKIAQNLDDAHIIRSTLGMTAIEAGDGFVKDPSDIDLKDMPKNPDDKGTVLDVAQDLTPEDAPVGKGLKVIKEVIQNPTTAVQLELNDSNKEAADGYEIAEAV